MIQVEIALHGCDDITYVTLNVTQEQLEFLEMLATITDATSQYVCQPTMEVKKI